MKKYSLSWVSIAFSITALCMLIFAAVQQLNRLTLYEQSAEVTQRILYGIKSGQDVPKNLLPVVDLQYERGVFIVLYDAATNKAMETIMVDGKTVNVPVGVLNYAKAHGNHRVTWQPTKNVREAIIVTYVSGSRPVYVVVGKSVLEAESRIETIGKLILIGWFLTLVGSFVLSVVLLRISKQKLW
jgi:hypothetical protein